ncbi:hypothetical protein PVAP13_3NG222826 [Panicum virgatum]|uniref:SAM domain-containing protein n=1 Tax=Panicum virgatum TaxID=38727 RepID=A0A8T0UFL3_PANVG|nr:hypothetical protein PVAP13_3NG222826 [Panicum virgatum]
MAQARSASGKKEVGRGRSPELLDFFIWTVEDDGLWLEEINLGGYRQVFEENGVNGEYLESLSMFTTEQILRFIRRCHMKWGDFITLCKELRRIKGLSGAYLVARRRPRGGALLSPHAVGCRRAAPLAGQAASPQVALAAWRLGGSTDGRTAKKAVAAGERRARGRRAPPPAGQPPGCVGWRPVGSQAAARGIPDLCRLPKGEQEVRRPWWAPSCLSVVFVRAAKQNRKSRVVSLKLEP